MTRAEFGHLKPSALDSVSRAQAALMGGFSIQCGLKNNEIPKKRKKVSFTAQFEIRLREWLDGGWGGGGGVGGGGICCFRNALGVRKKKNCLIIFISAPLRFAALGLCECWRRLSLMEAQNLTLRVGRGALSTALSTARLTAVVVGGVFFRGSN